jgi:hypothetical protein
MTGNATAALDALYDKLNHVLLWQVYPQRPAAGREGGRQHWPPFPVSSPPV